MGLMSGISRGLSAAGYAAADMFSKAALDEQRMKLEEEKALRIADAMEARKNAPMQRFSGLMSAKMSEQVPQEAEAVTKTTSEGAKAAGLQDGLVGMTREQVAAYKDPDMLAQYDKQMGEDKRLAEEKVAGKTRPRSQEEGIKSALEEALMNDPQAYVAGRALTAADKEDIEERKMASREKIENARNAQREKESTFRDEQAERRHQETMARLEKQGKSASDSSNKQMQMQFAIAMRQQIESVDRDIRELEKNKKGKFDDEIKEINENITEKKEARKQLVEMQTDYFSDSGIKVPTPRESKPDGNTGSAPHADGTRLRKNGQMYIVKGGVPVLESEASRTSTGKIK